jgi:hypothetical protein
MVQYSFHPTGTCAFYSRHMACKVIAAVNLKKDVKLKSSLSTPYRMSGGTAPLILNLSTRWSSTVNFTPRSHHHQGNSPDTNRKRLWVGPLTSLDVLGNNL